MKNLAILMSYVLIAVFMVSCSNDSEEQVIQQPEGFTVSDLSEIQAFKNFSEKSLEKMRPVAVNAIKRNRASTRGGVDEFTPMETAVMMKNLAAVGKETATLLKDMGADMKELNEVLPYERNKELYGIVGLEVFMALDPTDTRIDEGPIGCEIAIKVNWGKALECFAGTLGINIGLITSIVPAVFKTSSGGASYLTKKAIFAVIKEAYRVAKERLIWAAVGGGVGLVAFIGEWAFCYFDAWEMVKGWLSSTYIFKRDLPLQNIYNLNFPLPSTVGCNSYQAQLNTNQMLISPFDVQTIRNSNQRNSFSMS